MSAATASNSVKRRHGKPACPRARVTAVRPPGMKRETSDQLAAARGELALGPGEGLLRLASMKEALVARVPKRRPTRYAVLSPRNAPQAAATMISGR